MSRRLASVLLGLSLSACANSAAGQRANPHIAVSHTVVQGNGTEAAQWLGGAVMHSRVLVGSDGETYVGLWVDTPRAVTAVARAPLDVALVVDTSGSMSGPKIQNARMAAASFIDGLAEGDIVSLHAFSDAPRVLAPPTVVNRESRALLLAQLGGLYAAGGTNLYGGLSAGQDAVSAAPSSHPVRRVVVISDGRANIGPSTAAELGDLAARVTENGAQITSIGVGLDYDESTLGTLAARTAGRLYHLEQPQQMATILHDELELLGQTVATNAVIEFAPAPGVTLEPVGAAHIERDPDKVRVPLGSLYGSQHREVLLRVRTPAAARGQHHLGTAQLRFEDPVASNARRSSVPVALHIDVAGDIAAAPVDERVAAMVTRFEVAQQQQRAARLLNEGQAAQADAALAEAQERLRRAQATVRDEATRASLAQQQVTVSRNRASTQRVAAPTAAPGAARGAALQMNADSMRAMGY